MRRQGRLGGVLRQGVRRARPLAFGAIVRTGGGERLPVEYAGAAPGLLCGVTQINVKLPEAIPQVEGYPRNGALLSVETPGVSFYPGLVAVHVNPD